MTHADLYKHLDDTVGFKSPQIAQAFNQIDRADFAPEGFRSEAYFDYPLPIGRGQTISQPSTVAIMLNLLDPKRGEKILDIGSGSGWTTALLANITGSKGRVWGLEIIPDLVKFGQSNLAKYGFKNAKIQQAKKEIGLPRQAPFDKILVSAAAEELPKDLLKQLKIGGRMAIPIRYSVKVITKKSNKDFEKEDYPGFAFVPLK